MDPTGLQNRLSGGKRRKDVYSGEEEVIHESHKISRRWMTGRGDDNVDKDSLNQALDFRPISADHWMRLQQQQKIEPAAPTTPLNTPMSLQQRALTVASLHDIRNIEASKQPLHPCQPPQTIASSQPQQQQQQQQQQLHQQQQQQQQLQHQQQQLQQQLQHQQQQQLQQSSQHTNQLPNGGQPLKYQQHQHQQLETEQMQMHMPYLDLTNTSRAVSSLPPLPLSFRPPPIFAESDLRHSPTSSSSNPYPLQSVLPQRLPQGSTLLPESDEDRYSSVLGSSQSTVIQQSPSGMSGTSNTLVLQELQASAAWYSSMRELETQPTSSSRLGRASLSNGPSLSNGQNVSLYSSPSLSDLTTQGALPPLAYQASTSGAFRDGPVDQEQILGDPQSPLPYSVTGSSSSSVIGPKGASSMPRLHNNKPVYQNDFPGRRMLQPGPYCPSSSGADLLLQPNIMGNGSLGLPDENCFIQRPPPPKPVRTYTKVYKLGSIGRALDVTRFSNYDELRCELARMFNLDGQLDQRSGWQLVFLDNENDILLVGDDPWDEFVSSVRGIRILSPSEVNFYMNEDRLGAAYNTLNPGTLKQY